LLPYTRNTQVIRNTCVMAATLSMPATFATLATLGMPATFGMLATLSSFPRMRESSPVSFWIPAFPGTTKGAVPKQ
ncbi:MAG: hypothetical protein ACO1PZ_00845, partial [Gammaproteobacteria bacterium]